MKRKSVRIVIILCLILFIGIILVFKNYKMQSNYEKAMVLYEEFLAGEKSVKESSEQISIDYISIPTGEPDRRYHTEYAYFDSNGDKIPELHIKSARYYFILSCRNDKLIIWKNLSPNPVYYPLNSGAFMGYRPGGAPMHDDYIYRIFDYGGNEVYSFGFSRYDSNQNGIYDENDEYSVESVVTKQVWESLTEPYLDTEGRIKESIRNEIDWKLLYDGT